MISAGAYHLLLDAMAQRDTQGVIAASRTQTAKEAAEIRSRIDALMADAGRANEIKLSYEIGVLSIGLDGCDQNFLILGPARERIVQPEPAASGGDRSGTPAFASSAVAAQDAWNFSESHLKMTDDPSVFLTTEAIEGTKTIEGAHEAPELLLRCSENTTAAFIHFGGAFMSDAGGFGEVEYRVDDRKMRMASMDASTSNEALGFFRGAEAIPFIKDLLGGKQSLVRATPFEERVGLVTFDITGIDERIKPLRKICGW
ncbi:type VI secretion protein [Cereibacter sphaeroides]|uniref:type VI secretion system-associated protein TagO n=1 Tax=Cereibacter sphaeroides TaxID=1063 RepID=UPI001F444EA0|nr:type VI secretion system-associated protein TagO [Cereibacter sphaeroides]MCE6949892.1 type VI secretion protein [Cereibacter sphaeroides]